jgi:prevent-host-death family protein
MQISATEFKNNVGRYLMLAAQEDIIVTKNGKGICKTHQRQGR